MEQGRLADTECGVHHALVQQAGGKAVPLRLCEDLVDGDLLEVEEHSASVGPPAPLTGVRHLVAVGTPEAVQLSAC